MSTPRLTPVSVGCAPPRNLTDSVVLVRPPLDDDIDRLGRYGSDPRHLDGLWVGRPPRDIPPDTWAAQRIRDWQAGWTPIGSTESGALIIDESEPFVGVVVLVPRPANAVELVYGIAPSARGRGIASRAARLVADWALTETGFDRVELRIDESHAASRRVAEKAGFRFVERFETFITGTGNVVLDTLYVRARHDGSAA